MLHDSFEVRKVLIVAPIRVAKVSWPDEIQKWDHLSELRYSVAVGSKEETEETANEQGRRDHDKGYGEVLSFRLVYSTHGCGWFCDFEKTAGGVMA